MKQAGFQGEHMGYGIAASPDGTELTVTGTFGSGVVPGYIEFGAGEPNEIGFGTTDGGLRLVCRAVSNQQTNLGLVTCRSGDDSRRHRKVRRSRRRRRVIVTTMRVRASCRAEHT